MTVVRTERPSPTSTRAPGSTRLIENPGAEAVLLLDRSRLMVTRGADRGKEFLLERPGARVGTHLTNDLVLTDPTVSTHHFEVCLGEHGPLLRDAGSTNGTFVDGHRALEIYLKDRSEVTAGESTVRFTIEHGQIEVPLSQRTNFGALLGHSPIMRAAFAVLERAAPADTTLLIEGETGTGKELAVRAVHQHSARAARPLQFFDCGAQASSLIESQLFGHVKGAFSGATEDRRGALESAHTGTLVLDEIGELPAELQPKLLRCLETRTVTPVGSDTPRQVDVRLIAATNRNLAQEVHAGRFREDLFFRLSVITVKIPSLRERKEEIPRLAAHFLRELGAPATLKVPPALMALLMSHHWPGNVRELRNVVQRLVALPGEEPGYYLRDGFGAEDATDAAGGFPEERDFHRARRQWLDEFEKIFFSRALASCGGNISEVARESHVSRKACHRLIQKHGLRTR